MSILSFLLRKLDRVIPPQAVYAHCDVPCGIYDKFAALQAAQTVRRMVEQLLNVPGAGGELAPERPSQDAPKEKWLEYENAVVRRVWTKEEHARKCKEELLILWTDYFKPEHLQIFPDLHDKVWKAAKLCSKAKQTVDLEVAKQLEEAVHDIGHMWEAASGK